MSVAVTETPVVGAEGEPTSAPVEKYKFDSFFQSKIAALAIRDTSFMQRTEGLIKPEYFEDMGQAMAVDLANRYFERYKKVPADINIYATLMRERLTAKTMTPEQARITATTLSALKTQDISDKDFVVDQVATFARHQAVADAMYKAVTCLDRRDFTKIEKLMKQALDVGAHMDNQVYDYAQEIESRTFERIEAAKGVLPDRGITTGYPKFDEKLYRKGWGKRELSVLMGGAKAGKSTALMDFGVNAMAAGHNVLYVTLELGKDIIAERMDANISERLVMELGTHLHDVRDKVKQFTTGGRPPRYPGEVVPKPGAFKIVEYPSGSMTIGDLRRLLESYKGKGLVFDLVIVDYADLMAPERYTDSITENSKSVYVNLRGLAMKEGFAVLTATQTNRAGASKAVAKMDDVAEDFNKIRIADLVISINRTDEERAMGEARLFFAASRNQPGNFSLRISQDLDRMKFVKDIIGVEA